MKFNGSIIVLLILLTSLCACTQQQLSASATQTSEPEVAEEVVGEETTESSFRETGPMEKLSFKKVIEGELPEKKYFSAINQFGNGGIYVSLSKFYPSEHEFIDGDEIGKPGQLFFDGKRVFGGFYPFDSEGHQVMINKVVGITVHYSIYNLEKDIYEFKLYELPPEMYDDLYDPNYDQQQYGSFLSEDESKLYAWFSGADGGGGYTAVFYFDLKKRTVKRNISRELGVISDTRIASY